MTTPICFMVMPFGTKPTGLPLGKGPLQVDFNALWNKVLEPAIKELGYLPIRADQETGALIIQQMLRRLTYADLVIADISIANANVYYEIGVRHAAKDRHCVLIAADWSKPVFDLGQMRRVSYPMSEGDISDDTAALIRTTLLIGVKEMIQGTSPVFEAVPDFPDARDDDAWCGAFKAEIHALAAWGEKVAGIRAISNPNKRKQEAFDLRNQLLSQPALPDGVWIEMLHFIRDCTSDWLVVLEWIKTMPKHLRTRIDIEEQRLLALAKSSAGNLEERVGAIKHLIEHFGPSSERCGLLGGRYKDLYDEACKAFKKETHEPEKMRLLTRMEDYLDSAIEAYYNGMLCDLNDYYPSCNLPGLLQIRANKGDAELARTAAGIAATACQRAKTLGSKDPWINPTLLQAAFQSNDVSLVKRLAKEARREGPAIWQLESVSKDLWRTLEHTDDENIKASLEQLLEQIEQYS